MTSDDWIVQLKEWLDALEDGTMTIQDVRKALLKLQSSHIANTADNTSEIEKAL